MPLLPNFWSPSSYAFWFVLVGVAISLLERLRPWRPSQPFARPALGQDLVWLVLNGLYLGGLISLLAGGLAGLLLQARTLPGFLSHPVAAHLPWWAQFVLLLVGKDLVEYGIHNLLHRVPWLWRIHQLHHSILDMDWVGNLRFHVLEVVVYRTLTWLPVSLVLVSWQVALAVAVTATVIGDLNHANLRWDWGPLRHVLNSPRFHIWHHDRSPPTPVGCNFGIIFSAWDWIFGTAHWPADRDQPEALGFAGMERYPRTLLGRLCSPFRRWSSLPLSAEVTPPAAAPVSERPPEP